jgi:pimeloyl-ACP methyl ester carboxylesterase
LKTSNASRELITLSRLGTIVHATLHPASPSDCLSPDQPEVPQKIGVVFLNSLSPTRAAHGDSAVFWADSFACAGYPAIRLDLPGFGDSAGEPPPDLLNSLNSGHYAGIVSTLTAEILERWELSGVVLVGLCAGALTAVFSAGTSERCKGTILMDPYFHLPFKKPSRIREKLTGRFLRSEAGRRLTAGHGRLKAARQFFLGDLPPGNANFHLLDSWKQLASAGLPMLVFKAPGAARAGEFDYSAFLQKKSGRKSQVVWKTVEGAGHTFSNKIGREAVRAASLDWLKSNFSEPVAQDECLSVSESGPIHPETSADHVEQTVHA